MGQKQSAGWSKPEPEHADNFSVVSWQLPAGQNKAGRYDFSLTNKFTSQQKAKQHMP